MGRLLPSQSYSTKQGDLKMNVKRAAPSHLPGRAAQRQIDCKRPRACVWLVAAWALKDASHEIVILFSVTMGQGPTCLAVGFHCW